MQDYVIVSHSLVSLGLVPVLTVRLTTLFFCSSVQIGRAVMSAKSGKQSPTLASRIEGGNYPTFSTRC
jgi:hypothetical protein